MHSDRPLAGVSPWILAAMFSCFLACSPEGDPSAEATGAGSTGAGSAGAPAESAPASQISTGRFVGNVVETMNAGNYTYVALERGGEKVWAAGPQTTVAIGDEIAIGLQMRMDNFHSDSLDRTFPALYFVGELHPTGEHTASGGHGQPAGAGSPGGAAARPNDDSVDKPEGGYRVAEVWDRRNDLADREVILRGRVVKYNAGILDRNWLHIQDGSGDPELGNHDVTITTDQTASIGDLVTVKGVVSLDKDFGSGYRYAVLVEGAEVTVE